MKKLKTIKNESKIIPEVKKSSSPVNDPENRREFLSRIWKWLGIIIGAEVIAVFFGFLTSGKKDNEKLKPKQLFNVGSVETYKNSTVTVFRGGRFYLVRLDDGGFMALSLRCTHLGCSISWEEDKTRFICPCHSSAFHMNGEVQNPPAPSALDYYPVFIENGIIKVDAGTKLVRKRFDKSQAAYV